MYALINALPAVSLCAYGFITPGLPGSLAFGAGLGITLFGIAYMFVHDGLVHRRFPVGPIAQLPYMRRVSVAHRLHHSEKYGGVPWGLFLGPQVRQAYARHSTAQHSIKKAWCCCVCCAALLCSTCCFVLCCAARFNVLWVPQHHCCRAQIGMGTQRRHHITSLPSTDPCAAPRASACAGA